MNTKHRELIEKAYINFNARIIPAILETMQPDVAWPKGWEGGYIKGHKEVEAYWTKQWSEINPTVHPVGFTERDNGQIEVAVHQVAKGLDGTLLFDGTVKHIYTFTNDLIQKMEIE